ncbi:MAG TPA: hypothetical protein VEZ90_06420 [Blastocatellia bacterium]|nr:hypothetical protein [Blastocatellia bacterium]
MNVRLEDEIRDAILTLRWRRQGDGLHPSYFVDSLPGSFQLRTSTASFLAQFIADCIAVEDQDQDGSAEHELDRYSLEVIASYLEDRGYIVLSSP